MKVLRTTMWSPDLEPTTVVMRGEDIRFPVEETITDPPGMFLIHDVFEMSDGVSIEEATLEATAEHQRRHQRERDQAIAYYWWAMMLPRVNPGGIVMADKPAPLNRSEMETVLRQLQRHPNYRDQSFMVVIENEHVLTMSKDGEISEVDPGTGR